MKNLNERATLAFQKLFQGRIAIPVTPGTRNIRYEVLIGTTAQRIQLVKKLRGEGRSQNEIILLTGLSERMVKKYVHMKEWMIRLLYKPAEDVKGISTEQLAAIFTSYPLAKSISDIVNKFKSLY